MRKNNLHIILFFIWVSLLAGCQLLPAKSRSTAAPDVPPPAAQARSDSSAPAFYYFSAAQMKLKEGQITEAQYYLEKAIQYDPKSAVVKLELANLYILQQKSDQALALIHQALEDHPGRTDALTLAGRIHLQNGDVSEAKALFEQAINQPPSDPNVFLYLGRIYWNENDLANADRVFRRMVASFPNSYAAYFFSGKVLAAQGKYDQAIEAFQHSLALEPSLEEARFELIDIYRTQKHPKQVIQTYRDILESNPENTRAAFELAVEYNKQGRPSLAEPLLVTLGQRSDRDTSIMSYVFENYLETKQFETAAWAVEGMLKGASGSSELHYLAGVAYDGLKDATKALIHMGQVTETSRFYENAVVHRALLYRNQGKIEQSIAVIKLALLRNPNSADYYLYLGSFYEELERYDEALAAIEHGISLDGENYRLFFRKGVVHDKIGDRQAAIEAMKRVLQLNPKDVETLNYLGYTYAEMGIHLDEAETLIQNALKLKPSDGYINDSMAWVYFKQGRYEEALKWLGKAVSLVPDDAVILEHLGDVYLKLDHKEKALKYYRRSLEIQNKDRSYLEEKIRALNGKH